MTKLSSAPAVASHDPAGGATPESLSQLTHRRLIGILGLLLPALLYVLAGLLPTAGLPRWKALNSVSAYYYTGAVSVFAGVLFALALFLLTYPGYKEVAADRVVGRLGGLAAIAVALFPTSPPDGLLPPSWWHHNMAMIHHASAVILFVAFILFAIWLFRKSNIPERRDRPLEKRRRDDICLACGIVMIVAVLWAASSMVTHAPIFLPESIAIIGFAVSWLTKGEAHKPVMQIVSRVRQRLTMGQR
jgi:heme/copper-type cytochrome/quinol oxidase subunit 2